MPESALDKILTYNRADRSKSDLVITPEEYKQVFGKDMPGGSDHVMLFPEYVGAQNMGPVILARKSTNNKGDTVYSDVQVAFRGKYVTFDAAAEFTVPGDPDGNGDMAIAAQKLIKANEEDKAITKTRLAAIVTKEESALADSVARLMALAFNEKMPAMNVPDATKPKEAEKPAAKTEAPDEKTAEEKAIEEKGRNAREVLGGVLRDKRYMTEEQRLIDPKFTEYKATERVHIGDNLNVLTPEANVAEGVVGPIVFARRENPTEKKPQGDFKTVHVLHEGKVVEFDLGGQTLTEKELNDPQKMREILDSAKEKAKDPGNDKSEKLSYDEIAVPLLELGQQIKDAKAKAPVKR